MPTVASYFLTMPQHQQILWTGWVQQGYQTYFGRAATAAEVAAWLPVFQAGLTQDQFIDWILVDGPFQARLTNNWTLFVQDLYTDLLGQTAPAAGLNTCVTYMQQGGSVAALVGAFLEDTDHATQQSSLSVAVTYQSYFGQALSSGLLSYVVGLLQAGMSQTTLQLSWLCSPAYYARAQQNY
jgi:hypothetical protein